MYILYNCYFPTQAAELEKELQKEKPDPINKTLSDLEKTLKSSIAAALEEHKQCAGTDASK